MCEYSFIASYENMDNFSKRELSIIVDSFGFKSEKNVFIKAMELAYKYKRDNECFDKLEFISC